MTTTVETPPSAAAAIEALDAYVGHPTDFVLRMRHDLIGPTTIDGLVVTGMQMAVITDAILAKGWIPDSCSDDEVYRSFRYVEA